MFCTKARLLSAAVLLLISTAAAAGQDYLFGVPELEMQVFVKPDASLRIVSDITFQNRGGAHAIDIVDIGVPHSGYNLSNIRASSDGLQLRDIRDSEVVTPGFEVHMGIRTIGPGRSGKLHVEFEMPNMVFQDTTNEELASLRITPTWFGEQYVIGNTHIKVAVHLPGGVKPDEALYHSRSFSQKALFQDRTVLVWDWPADRLTGPHMVGVSFPKREMTRVVKITKLGLLVKWFSESFEARVWAAIFFFLMFGFAFFRFSSWTGFSVFFVLSIVCAAVFYVSPGWHLALLPTVVCLVFVNEWFLRRRKTRYMPPIAQVEGGGIKRGLTAPKAAALLELPIAKVLSLVVFGMLKKGILRQVQADPLAVEVADAFTIEKGKLLTTDKDRAKFYRKVGQKRGFVIHKYEHPFIYLLESNPGKPVKELNFGVPMKGLLERAAARMKGFDLSDTRDYYRSIIKRAMDQAAAIGDIPQREKALDRNFEWLLMDDAYPTVFTYGRPYRPIWSRGPMTTSSIGGGAASRIPGQTSFGDVAASFAGWTENTMGSMASAIAPGSLNIATPSGGFVDLSGADSLTGEFFQALGEISTSGGGGGGGGGCACAGCACACACAGGGR